MSVFDYAGELSNPVLTRPPSNTMIFMFSAFWFCICWTLFHTARAVSSKLVPDYNTWEELVKIKWCKRIISGMFGFTCGSGGIFTAYNYFMFGYVSPDYMHDMPMHVMVISHVWYLSIGYLAYDTITLVYYNVYLSRELIIHHVVFSICSYVSLSMHTWLGYLGVVQAFGFTDFLVHLSWCWREIFPKDSENLRILSFLTALSTGMIRIVLNAVNVLGFVAWSALNMSAVMDSPAKWATVVLMTMFGNYVVIPPAVKLCHQTFIQKKNWHASHRRASEEDNKVM